MNKKIETKENNKKNEAEKMREVLLYIMANMYKPLKLEQAAKDLGYRPRSLGDKFLKYFEMPFATFVAKMRLRRTAQEIYATRPLKINSERYGFTSDSNLYRAFKKEFGVTPKQFRESSTLIPDMPCKAMINQHPVSMEYQKVDTIEIEGYPVWVKEGKDTDLLENVAYVFRHPNSHVDMNCREPQWGVWWHDREHDETLHYVAGGQAKPEEKVKPGYVRLKITGGDYAVFSVERGADYFDIAATSRELARYVFHIWKDMNYKTMDVMGFTYEKFDAEKSYLYIPLLKGMGGIEMDVYVEHENVVQKIVKYVDEHIMENLTAEEVVAQFKYSDFFCRDRFTSCYNISLPDYIRKKRLYVLAKKLQEGEIETKAITQKYGFRTMVQFQKEFQKEYGVKIEQWEEITSDLVDISEYYAQNFHRLNMFQTHLKPLQIIGKVIKSGTNKEEVDLDVPGMAGFWMQNDFSELKGTKYACPKRGMEDKIVVYETVSGKPGEKDIHNCVLGVVIPDEKEKTGEKKIEGKVSGKGSSETTAKVVPEEIPETMHLIDIEGGEYIVFEHENINVDDTEELTEVIRLIILCVEHQWIYENWVRTDFRSRVSFFRYHQGKISYYVPIYS